MRLGSKRWTSAAEGLVARWLGDAFREAAVLIAVLAPMELFVKSGFLTWEQSAFIVVLTVFCLAAGFVLGLIADAE